MKKGFGKTTQSKKWKIFLKNLYPEKALQMMNEQGITKSECKPAIVRDPSGNNFDCLVIPYQCPDKTFLSHLLFFNTGSNFSIPQSEIDRLSLKVTKAIFKVKNF